MSGLGLPISNLVSVAVNVSPAGATVQNFNSALVVGTGTVIDLTTRMRTYATLLAVANDFGTSAAEYLAASVWFGQNPAPQNLSIGRWANVAAAGQLIGGAVTAANQVNSIWTAITAGAFYFLEDGVPWSVSGLNFSAVTNMNGVASVIQTALAINEVGTTCTWSSVYQNFTITSGTTGASSSVSVLSTSTASGSVIFAGQPANNDTLTIDGTLITFVTGTPSGSQVKIGSSLPVTLASLLAFLNASVDVNLVLMSYLVVGSNLYLTSKATGTTGNAYTLAKSGTNISLSASTLAGGAAVSIATTLAGTTAAGAFTAAGQALETALAAVTAIDNQYPGSWYGLIVIGAADSDHTAIAAYIEADAVAKHFYGVTTSEAGVLSSSSTTDIAYVLAASKYNHTATQYSNSSTGNPYAILSAMARILTTNWLGFNTAITLMYKQEPGVVAETLTASQAAAAAAKYCNTYVNYNSGIPIIQNGTSCSGLWVDEVIGLDWFSNYLQIEIFNLLFGANKVPQTDAGMHQIATVINAVCQTAVENGLVAPGQWNSAGFGTLVNGAFLSKGFYVYQPPISTQSEATRQTRVSVNFTIALKLAGAVHDVAITVNVNQ